MPKNKQTAKQTKPKQTNIETQWQKHINSVRKFKITIKEEKSLESLDIDDSQNLFDDFYLVRENHDQTNDLTIYNFQTK